MDIDWNDLDRHKWMHHSKNMNHDQSVLNVDAFTEEEKAELGQRMLELFNDSYISGANILRMEDVFSHIVNSQNQLEG
jgi:hypothetical protein